METIRKPRGWERNTLDELVAVEAGQAYLAEQLGGTVEPGANFRSSRNSQCGYDLFDDGSLWFHSNADDEVWVDARDFVDGMQFDGLSWSDSDATSRGEIDAMDRDLLLHLYGDVLARKSFEQMGGRIDLDTVEG